MEWVGIAKKRWGGSELQKKTKKWSGSELQNKKEIDGVVSNCKKTTKKIEWVGIAKI